MLYKKYIKHLLDILIATSLLIVTSPILFLAIVGLVLANRSLGVFFLQKRPGLKGELFALYKLKTLRDIDVSIETQTKDSERVTKLGRILRKYSIDELPQLFNVLKGDMSLIGPRPLLPEYLPHYNPKQFQRHEVKPGMSGWAQVNGRNSMTFIERLEYDVWYVNNLSFFLDLKIFFRTLILVFKSTNVLQDDPNIFILQVDRDKKVVSE